MSSLSSDINPIYLLIIILYVAGILYIVVKKPVVIIVLILFLPFFDFSQILKTDINPITFAAVVIAIIIFAASLFLIYKKKKTKPVSLNPAEQPGKTLPETHSKTISKTEQVTPERL